MNGRFWVETVLVVMLGAPVVSDVPQSMVGGWIMKGIGSLAGFDQTTESLEAGIGLWSLQGWRRKPESHLP